MAEMWKCTPSVPKEGHYPQRIGITGLTSSVLVWRVLATRPPRYPLTYVSTQ